MISRIIKKRANFCVQPETEESKQLTSKERNSWNHNSNFVTFGDFTNYLENGRIFVNNRKRKKVDSWLANQRKGRNSWNHHSIKKILKVQVASSRKFLKMGQAVSSCAPCCTANEDVESSWESYQKSVPNDKNPQWKEKLKTNDNKIVLVVNPMSTEEEIAADRMKILMNLGAETWRKYSKKWKIKYQTLSPSIFKWYYWSRNKVFLSCSSFFVSTVKLDFSVSSQHHRTRCFLQN